MKLLSVVIITYNEEKNIGRCLDSVKDIADDIVVVDSFSTDRTEEICLEKGARFICHAFTGHVEQKNYAITQARYPHILSLDADEALSDELRESILRVKKDWHCDGYYMNRLTNYCGHWVRHCGWYPDKKLRMWDSRKGQWGGTNPHDRYEMHKGCTTSQISGDILHFSFYTIGQHIKQVDYFTDIASNALFKKGKKVGMFTIIMSPWVKFVRDFFLRKGFQDGYYGLVICIISAFATFLKYVKLRELNKAPKTEQICRS